MSCPTFAELACGAEVAPEHVAGCRPCAEALQDLATLRAEARRLGPRAWVAGSSPAQDEPPRLDVEAGLAALWAQADRAQPRRGARLLQFTSRAAAALLIAGLGAPYLLEARKARAPRPSPTPVAEASSVFWTHPVGVLAARK